MSQRRLQRTPAPESPTIGAPAVAITSVEARVAAMLTGFQPFATGASVVVAVSGGADSLCLLGALMSLRAQGRACAAGEVVVATFDHGLRGGASAADTRWVADFAGEQGLRCIVGQGDTQALARDEHRSLEDAARRLRYAFLRRIAAEVGAERICLGHTR
ncbi:MAG TPA: ATP-binding protein, partial [Ktedonobacterales bacterium]|nr:ATP-binding protein [Ktedonobacterales bacterium]